SEMNVVPLIDILLVLLVIFMMIPAYNKGLDTLLPQQSTETNPDPLPAVIVVQVANDGSLKINQEPVERQNLEARLDEIFKQRAQKIAFIRGEDDVQFSEVAQVIDVMHTSGIGPIGLMTPAVEKAR